MDALAVRKATTADVPKLAESLANSFDTDPFVNWLVRRDNKRREGIVQLFKTALNSLSIPFGEVLTANNMMGGSIWIPSNNVKISFLKQLTLLSPFTKIAGASGLMRVVKCLDILDKVHPTQKHYYLFFVGVDPSQRKQGLGGALLQPVLEKCDSEGVGAYLENTNCANQSFYESFGFKVTGDIIVGKDAPVLKAMWRNPAGK